MAITCFSFEMGGQLCGAILRTTAAGRSATRTVFRPEPHAPIYLVDHELIFDGSARDWRACRHRSAADGVDLEAARDVDGRVSIGGNECPDLADAVPSYAEHLIVEELVSSDHPTASYRHFAEGGTAVADVVLRRETTETVTGPNGTLTAERVRTVVDGEPTNTHWCRNGQVVASDWGGAVSWLYDSPDELISRIGDIEVAEHVQSFLATHRSDSLRA